MFVSWASLRRVKSIFSKFYNLTPFKHQNCQTFVKDYKKISSSNSFSPKLHFDGLTRTLGGFFIFRAGFMVSWTYEKYSHHNYIKEELFTNRKHLVMTSLWWVITEIRLTKKLFRNFVKLKILGEPLNEFQRLNNDLPLNLKHQNLASGH